MATTFTQRGRVVFSRPGADLFSAARALFRRYRKWRHERQAIRHLMRLDDHLLKDIGLHRSEISSVVHEDGSSRRQTYGTR